MIAVSNGAKEWGLGTLDGEQIAAILGALVGLLGALVAAVIAAVVAVKAYKTQQREQRRQERAAFYADAIRAVEDYTECPYRIRRRDGTAEARREITQHVSNVKSRISFYTAWMVINASERVRAAYEVFVKTAENEAGRQMSAAWRGKPTKRDRDVPIGRALPRKATDVARSKLLEAMKNDLATEPRRRHKAKRPSRI
ncbi:hypothetical protein [Actinophytocola sp. NPDC049390]|uniref:hypothetical protein n=1 Tax=Actinophytocola sp. NPDC049390 TaxID=3363894 RepID=UPI0037943312